jgi:hypothetical protein
MTIVLWLLARVADTKIKTSDGKAAEDLANDKLHYMVAGILRYDDTVKPRNMDE